MPHQFPPSIYSGVPASWDEAKKKHVSMLAVVRLHRKAAALARWFRKQRLDDRIDTATIYSTDDLATLRQASLSEIAKNLGPVTVGRLVDDSANPPREYVIVDDPE